MTRMTNPAEAAKRLKAVIDTVIDGIILIDTNGIVESVNPAAANLFQYEEKEIIGNNISMLMPEPDHSNHDQYLRNYLNTGKAKIIGIGREVMGLKKDGSQFPLRLAVSEVHLDKGLMFTGIIHDLTDMKEAENEIRKLNEELEEKVEERTEELANVINRLLSVNKKLEREIQERRIVESELEENKEDLRKALKNERELGELKSRFVSMASHEFRTPLSTILSSASLLQRYTESDQQFNRDKHIKRIKSAVQSLNGILNDFLSLSKLEEGKVGIKEELFEISDVCDEIIDEMLGLLKDSQTITQDHQDPSVRIYSDRKIIKNILYNLLGNAIKYSGPDKSITLTSSISDNILEISVIDQGMGIPMSDQEYLFTRFFRASNAMNTQGTGLGLTIVKTYLDMVAGDISFSSEEGKGSEFTIHLPLKTDKT